MIDNDKIYTRLEIRMDIKKILEKAIDTTTNKDEEIDMVLFMGILTDIADILDTGIDYVERLTGADKYRETIVNGLRDRKFSTIKLENKVRYDA